jgi:hypothetical protein
LIRKHQVGQINEAPDGSTSPSISCCIFNNNDFFTKS